MFKGKSYFLTFIEWVDLWKALAAIVTLLGTSFAGFRALKSLRSDSLATTREELKTARSDIARLLREVTSRIDNERQYVEEVDALQKKISEQREQINDLLRNGQHNS